MPLNLLPRVVSETGFSQELSREMPSLTYELDARALRVRSSFIDGQAAMKQAIFKHLHTWLRSCDIYDDHFGFEAQGLIGKDHDFIQCELKRRIYEALMTDTRIQDVRNFRFSSGDQGLSSLRVQFRVITRFGELEWEDQIPIQ